MKHVGKIAVCLACELALFAGLRAATDTPPGNPYEPIVTRNVFGLNPPQPVDTTPHVDPPVKITPNGIMTIFGTRQVLFKVAVPARPGQPAKEDSYILGEGQRQDDITVTHINEKTGMVTFNNHGIVQEIPLTVAPAITTPAVATVAANRPGEMRNIPLPNSNNERRGFGRFGGRNQGNASNGNGAEGGSNLRNVPTQQQAQQVDPDRQILMIEALRQKYKEDGDSTANILPPTSLTPSDTTEPTPQ